MNGKGRQLGTADSKQSMQSYIPTYSVQGLYR